MASRASFVHFVMFSAVCRSLALRALPVVGADGSVPQRERQELDGVADLGVRAPS